MWPRSYLWASKCHETHTAIDGVVCEYIIAETNVVPPRNHRRLWCRVGYMPQWWQAMSQQWSVTGARPMSPIPAWHQQKPTLSRASGRNYTFACWSIYHVFPQICHLPNPLQLPLRKAVKNKSKFSLTLLCKRTVTSQRKFGGQNGVPREIGTRAQTVTGSEPKW